MHTDYVKGFGGKFGVQTDRQDKCALGWDHQEKVQLHESQKGTSILCRSFWFPSFGLLPVCPLLPWHPWPQLYRSWDESPFSGFEQLLCVGCTGVRKAGLTHLISSLWEFRFTDKFSLEQLFELADGLGYFFPFSFKLCKPQISYFLYFPQIISLFRFLFSVSLFSCRGDPVSNPVFSHCLWGTYSYEILAPGRKIAK